MSKDVIILVVEDDQGHAGLINRNLKRAGVNNKLLHFYNGQEVLDFFFTEQQGTDSVDGKEYIMLLDIRMPVVDGVTVLRELKANPQLKKIPVIMLTTTDDPREVQECHELGCNNYIVKPVDYDSFVKVIKQLGQFMIVVDVPTINIKAKTGISKNAVKADLS